MKTSNLVRKYVLESVAGGKGKEGRKGGKGGG